MTTTTTTTETTVATAVLQQLTADDVQYCTHKERGQHVGILDAFNKWVANGEHVMTVLRDDGLYRHLRFSKPNTGSYRFDLLTWPGYLTITGDMGCYTFTRLPDMFEFFIGYINTDYWAEKIADGGRASVKTHDEDQFKAWLIQDFWEGSRDMDATEARLWWEALRSDVFNDAYMGDQDSCHAVLRELDLNGMNIPAEHYMNDWDKTWNAYEWQFEFCLAAIVTGIRTYQAHKAQELNGATK